MMDFPPYFLDFFSNDLFASIISAINVIIIHPFLIGGFPLLVLLEIWAFKNNDNALDAILEKSARILFIVATTFGLLSGLGIWFASSLIAPYTVGSIFRVFFWNIIIGWNVTIILMGLLLAYTLLWKNLTTSFFKKLHIALGIAISFFSILLVTFIVNIVGFKINPGMWHGQFMDLTHPSTGLFNPTFLPQIAFHVTLSLMSSGILFWLFIPFFTKNNPDLRVALIRIISAWTITFTPLAVISGLCFWNAIPTEMHSNLGVSLVSQDLLEWQRVFLKIIGYTVATFGTIAGLSLWKPKSIPSLLLIIPFILNAWLLTHFDRVQDFINKPYDITNYIYSNGIKVSELPIYQRDGVLPYATYVKHNRVTKTNMIEAGQDVFMIACSRCHTTQGNNGIINNFTEMYADKDAWNEAEITSFIKSIHSTQSYVPPFPGNDDEIEALVKYIVYLKKHKKLISGAQQEGIQGNVQLTDPNAN